MKLIIVLSLLILTNSNISHAASVCESSGQVFDKDILELTYMEAEELKEEYCKIGRLKKLLMESSKRFSNTAENAASDSGFWSAMNESEIRLQQYSACGNYEKRIMRVLKKDHNVEELDCTPYNNK